MDAIAPDLVILSPTRGIDVRRKGERVAITSLGMLGTIAYTMPDGYVGIQIDGESQVHEWLEIQTSSVTTDYLRQWYANNGMKVQISDEDYA